MEREGKHRTQIASGGMFSPLTGDQATGDPSACAFLWPEVNVGHLGERGVVGIRQYQAPSPERSLRDFDRY
jgi:hypothetical protein